MRCDTMRCDAIRYDTIRYDTSAVLSSCLRVFPCCTSCSACTRSSIRVTAHAMERYATRYERRALGQQPLETTVAPAHSTKVAHNTNGVIQFPADKSANTSQRKHETQHRGTLGTFSSPVTMIRWIANLKKWIFWKNMRPARQVGGSSCNSLPSSYHRIWGVSSGSH